MLAKTHPYDMFLRDITVYCLLSDHSRGLWQDGRKQRNVTSIRSFCGTALSPPQHSPAALSGWVPSPQTPLNHGLAARSLRQTRRQTLWVQ